MQLDLVNNILDKILKMQEDQIQINQNFIRNYDEIIKMMNVLADENGALRKKIVMLEGRLNRLSMEKHK